jgi:hypothetical protein
MSKKTKTAAFVLITLLFSVLPASTSTSDAPLAEPECAQVSQPLPDQEET